MIASEQNKDDLFGLSADQLLQILDDLEQDYGEGRRAKPGQSIPTTTVKVPTALLAVWNAVGKVMLRSYYDDRIDRLPFKFVDKGEVPNWYTAMRLSREYLVKRK